MTGPVVVLGNDVAMLVNAVRYLDGVATARGSVHELLAEASEHGGFVWAGIHDPGDTEIEELISVFGIHPLAVEDVVKAAQRPKVERYDDWLLVVIKTTHYLDEPETVDFGEIQILCNDHSIIVIRRGEPVPLHAVRSRLDSRPDVLRSGPIAVLHAIVDAVVDSYNAALVGLDDDISEVELAVFSDDRDAGGSSLVQRIYFLQSELLELHRAMQPLTYACAHLRADPIVADADGWDAYIRDVEDHLLRQTDQLAGLRDLITGALAANTAQVGLRQNDDMRKISAWVAMAALPTMLAGIYGMNFNNMPELELRWGYPVVLGVMTVAVLVLHRAFRKSGWL